MFFFETNKLSQKELFKFNTNRWETWNLTVSVGISEVLLVGMSSVLVVLLRIKVCLSSCSSYLYSWDVLLLSESELMRTPSWSFGNCQRRNWRIEFLRVEIIEILTMSKWKKCERKGWAPFKFYCFNLNSIEKVKCSRGAARHICK